MKTWNDLKNYLLKQSGKADSERSKSSPSFTRLDMYNHYIRMCEKGGENELPIRTAHILIKNVKEDF